MDERFYTPKQVADILQVHQYTVLKWIREGKLRALKFGRVYRTTESELRAFLGQTAHESAQEIMRSVTDGSVVQASTVNTWSPHESEPEVPLHIGNLPHPDYLPTTSTYEPPISSDHVQSDLPEQGTYRVSTDQPMYTDQPVYSIHLES